jgi:hypothetical protein
VAIPTTLSRQFTTNPFDNAQPLLAPGYVQVQGTSYSAPLAVGIMALLQARAKSSSLNRYMTHEEIRWLVNTTVDQTDEMVNVKPIKSGGRINAQAAMELLNAIITGQARFFVSRAPSPSPLPANPPTTPPPPKKGLASCQLVLFSGFGHTGEAYRARFDWFSTSFRRTFTAQNLEMTNVCCGDGCLCFKCSIPQPTTTTIMTGPAL